MPSVSRAQRRFMAAAANNPKFAAEAGIPQSVAQDFHKADKKAPMPKKERAKKRYKNG